MHVMDEAESAVQRYEKMTLAERSGRLERSGIDYLAGRSKQIRGPGLRAAYEVHICCLQAIRIKRRDTGDASRLRESLLERDDASTLFRRLERMAVKTLYALGLDHGEVRLEAGGRNGCSVVSIDPRPWKGWTELTSLYREAWKQHQTALDEEQANEVSPVLGMIRNFCWCRCPKPKLCRPPGFWSVPGKPGAMP